MADRIYTTQLDSGVTQDFDAAWHTQGVEFRLTKPGKLVGGRCRYPTTDPANFIWAVYRLSDQAIVAQIDLDAFFGAGATNSAWNSFTSANFTTPGDVDLLAYPQESYIAVQATNGDTQFKNTGVSYPITSGGIVSGVNSRFINSGSGLTFPTSTNTTDWYPADVEIVAADAGSGRQVLPIQLILQLAARHAAQYQAVVGDAGYTQSATDDAGLTDTRAFDIGLIRTDDAGLTDSRAFDIGMVRTDDAGLTDAADILAVKLITATDDAGLTDSRAFDVGLVRTDDAGLTDVTAFEVGRTFTDSAGLTDTQSFDRTSVFTDSAGLTDGHIVDMVSTIVIPTRTLTATEIMTGNRHTKYYLDVLDANDIPLARLDGVYDGKLDWVANVAIKGAGQIMVRDVQQNINWLTARFRPVMVVEGLPIQPLGVFLPAETPESWNNGRNWNVKLLDKTTILDQDIITSTYSVAAGTVVTTEIISIITGAGITNYAITASTSVLAGGFAWSPGTSKLHIINDLLSTISYFSLYADLNGQLRGEPYVLPAQRPLVYEFIDGVNAIYEPNFVRDIDIWKIPNRVVVVGQGDSTTAALTSVIDNTDPDSPYSIANRGRVIGFSEQGVEAVNQAALDAYARRRLVELTTPTASVQIRHSPVPGLAVNQTVRFRRVPAGIDARHTVSKTELTLRGDALVVSTLREVVDL